MIPHAEETIPSGPASIVYNERGHRADEEEPDAFPEDDVGPPPEPRNRLRSEPVSRALTPTDHYFTSGNAERSQRSSVVEPRVTEIPEVVREQVPSTSRSLAASTPFVADVTQDLSRSLSVEQESHIKGKGKEKTPKATPKSTPKIGDTLNSIWGANPATNPPSPIPPSPLSLVLDGPKTPQLASVAHTPKGKDKRKSLDASSSKPSPSIPSNRSPLGTSEPIAEQPVEPLPVEPSAEHLALPSAEVAPSTVETVELSTEPPSEPPAVPSAEVAAEAADLPTDPLAEPPAVPSVEAAELPTESLVEPPAVPSTEGAGLPTEPLAEPPAASPAPAPESGSLLSSQAASPAISKKKKKGAAKGSSPALDTKTAPSSRLPTAAATPILASTAETQLADTSSPLPTETTKPDLLAATDTTSSATPPASTPAPAPATKSLSNVLAPVDLPDAAVNVATAPDTADTKLTLDASVGDSLLSPPKDSSLFGSSPWDNTANIANTEPISGFGPGSITGTSKTPKTPKIGASPSSPWGKSPAKVGKFSFGGLGSSGASPKPPSATPAKSPWGTWGISTPKSMTDTKPAEPLGLGLGVDTPSEPSKPDDLTKSASQENVDDTVSGLKTTESGNPLSDNNHTYDMTALSAVQKTPNPVSPPQPLPKPSPKPADGGLLSDGAAETLAEVKEPPTEQAATEHLASTSKNPSPRPEVSSIEDTNNPTSEPTEKREPDDAAAAEASAEATEEPKTPGDAVSPLTDNEGGAGGGDEEEGGEMKDAKKGKAAKKKRKGKGKS